MSDIHVLTTNSKGIVSVVFHFPVPLGDNSVGVPWRTALLNSGKGGTTQLTTGDGPGLITTPELAQILAGEVYEHADKLPLDSSGTTPGQHQVALRAKYARKKTAVLANLQRELKYFGHTEDES